MELDRFVAFVALSVAVVVIPGPDMALVTRNVVRRGRAAGYATSLGICTGILGWALAAAVGVSAILATSAAAFTVLKLAGAAYLVYLGVATLRSQVGAEREPVGGSAQGGGVAIGARAPGAGSPLAGTGAAGRRSYIEGLLSALLNPKLGVFFLTLLPQFVTPGDGAALAAAGLALVFDAIGLAWLLAYTTLLGAVRSALERPRAQVALQRVTGTLLIALGVRVALDRR